MYDNDNAALTGFLAGRADNNNCCGNGMNGMWGGEWFWPLIILFALFGWGGNGNGWGNGNNGAANFIPYAIGANGAVTRSDLCAEFNFNNLESAVRGVQQGLCDGFYAVNTSLLNGFHGVDNAVCNLGYQTQQGFNASQIAMMQGFNAAAAQASDCCCKTQSNIKDLGTQVERGFCDTNYNAATNTTAIIQSTHNDTDRILAKLDAMEMARKDETIANLRSQLAACGDQTTAQYIINQLTNTLRPCPIPSYNTCNPWAASGFGGCGYNGYNGFNGYNNCNNNGCGCNN